MLDLLFSVLLTGILFLVFKGFNAFKIDNLQAIIVNYIVAFSIGFSMSNSTVSFSEIPSQPWFIGTLVLGALFITVFNVLALTTQRFGFSVVSVASKMSLVIPVVFAVFMYGDILNGAKIIGLLLALLAVYFITKRKEDSQDFDKRQLYLPLALFIGAGVLDTLLNYIETTYVGSSEFELFTATIFMVAGVFGLLVMLVRIVVFKKKCIINAKNILGGICLGVPNYFSIYYLLKALNTEGISSATIFTINNVAVVLLATIIGLLFFKERLSRLNWLGAILSILAILMFYL
ncbi:MAG: hypothetical protein COB81_08060 [Flavobacteriaceae bacterium]|nr:MAG: hypothetical protein COB81_08060 [Flavobacteriaceae bacterium]